MSDIKPSYDLKQYPTGPEDDANNLKGRGPECPERNEDGKRKNGETTGVEWDPKRDPDAETLHGS